MKKYAIELVEWVDITSYPKGDADETGDNKPGIFFLVGFLVKKYKYRGKKFNRYSYLMNDSVTNASGFVDIPLGCICSRKVLCHVDFKNRKS